MCSFSISVQIKKDVMAGTSLMTCPTIRSYCFISCRFYNNQRHTKCSGWYSMLGCEELSKSDLVASVGRDDEGVKRC